MSLRHHTSGNSRPWQFRQPDHTLGNRLHVHGKVRPMEESGFFARLFELAMRKDKP